MTNLLSRLRLAEAEHCRQRSLQSSLLGEAADEIERLREALLQIAASVKAPEFADSTEVRQMAERALSDDPRCV